MTKKVPFEPLQSDFTKYGQLTVGKDGTLLYTSHETSAGEIVHVVLSTNPNEVKQLIGLINELSNKHSDYANRMASTSYDALLNNCEAKGKLH